MLLGQFNADERDLVDKFLAQAASERKSGKMADRTRHTLLNELFQVRADFPDRFLAGMEETTDREAPNINYLRKVIANLGQQKQRSLKFRDAQRRREEYEAKRKAQEKLDRAHERNMEDRKRRERARQEAGTHGPGRGGAAGGDMPRHGQGHGPEGDRRPPQNDKEQGAPAAAQGRGAVGDRGNGAPYTEVSLSDHIGPASPGASHADGEQPGDGDDGCGALVPA
jgi:type IV secretory pathway VirB10-like protein